MDNLVLQVFELSMVVVFLSLSLSLAVGQERATARRLNESEELFRRIFDTSVAGMVIATRHVTGWKVLRANHSAMAIISGLLVRRLEQEELERAAEVRRALLPGTLPPTPGWSSGAASVPARQVGEDFYDIRVEVPHAVRAVATRAALRTNDPQLSPSAAMSRVAGVVDHDLQRTSAFITLTYVLVDLVTGDFRFADAGHRLCFVVRTGSHHVERAASNGLPIGLDSGWDERHGALQPGDALLLVSNGVMDLWGGTVEQPSDAVAECAPQHGTSPQALVDALCARERGSGTRRRDGRRTAARPDARRSRMSASFARLVEHLRGLREQFVEVGPASPARS